MPDDAMLDETDDADDVATPGGESRLQRSSLAGSIGIASALMLWIVFGLLHVAGLTAAI